MAGIGEHGARLDHVETEVRTIRSEMGELKSDVGRLSGDVRALGGILGRIEAGVERAQEKNEQKEQAGRPSIVALVSVLVTIISIIVGGAWMISGNLAKQEERANAQAKLNEMFVLMRNREADQQNKDIRTLQDQINAGLRDRVGGH